MVTRKENLMKQFVLLSLVLVLLFSASPAQATTDPAYYAAFSDHGTLPVRTWKAIDASYFEVIQNGVVELNGATFVPTISGLIHISGTCQLKNPPGVWLMAIDVDGSTHYVIDSRDTVETIDITLPAGNIFIASYQEYAGGANAIKCALLFEAIP
jgi:hypothetical protein